MRKNITGTQTAETDQSRPDWLDLQALARVELTSEDSAHPIENALGESGKPGWQAAETGPQVLRLLFDEPVAIRHIRLLFRETETARTQELVLRWRSGPQMELQEIVRQQLNFSSPGSTEETEDYKVRLDGLTELELSIIPDISGGPARASIQQWRVA